jgi:hypothetical protein
MILDDASLVSVNIMGLEYSPNVPGLNSRLGLFSFVFIAHDCFLKTALYIFSLPN